ncbi:MAG: type III toxin-antitoxin system ToxN/AbiQ family toxin [Bacteroidales bacterium]|nr:type III toxin-antitoxin system ToxN/AbiQ family toxin [Bacteroidales bacterium]
MDSEVFYRPKGYVKKPFLGVIVGIGSYTYFIPFTSAKPKHKKWHTVYPDRFLIYEDIDKDKIDENKTSSKWICRDLDKDNKVRHILGALVIDKMIPVPDGVYRKVDIETEKPGENRDLLESEYRFCLSIQDKIIENVGKTYEAQMNTDDVHKYYCNFAALEKACDSYKPGGDERSKA